jgi:hypothetical protein
MILSRCLGEGEGQHVMQAYSVQEGRRDKGRCGCAGREGVRGEGKEVS